MEISAYLLVPTQLCVKPFSVFVTSPAASSAPVAGSYHLVSNCPGLSPCSRTVFVEPGYAFTRATITVSEGPPLNQRCSIFFTPSTSTRNEEFAESVAYRLAGMERFRKLLAVHKSTAALAFSGWAQTISTEGSLAASIAVKNCEEVVDASAPNFSMTGLFSPCSATHAASSCQPSA